MNAKIVGGSFPVLQVELAMGETVLAGTGQISWMTEGLVLNTAMAVGGASGFFGAIGRAVSGGGLFMTEITAAAAPGHVSFAAHLPGEILEMPVQAGMAYMVHKHGFLAATRGVGLGAGFTQSFGAGLFGGAGFVLQRIEGSGTAWVELGGDVVPYNLMPGQSMLVHPGSVGMFEASVRYEITRMKGVKNMLFGNEGLFLVRLSGPGRIWLQSAALASLAHALEPFLPKQSK